MDKAPIQDIERAVKGLDFPTSDPFHNTPFSLLISSHPSQLPPNLFICIFPMFLSFSLQCSWGVPLFSLILPTLYDRSQIQVVLD